MPLVAGPELDEIRVRAQQWYNETRAWLLEQLTDGYPYGTVKLSKEEQYARYLQMQPQDWLLMRQSLMNFYRGQPSQIDKVERGISDYNEAMLKIGQELGHGRAY